MSAVTTLLMALLQRPSLTPKDEGCQALIASHLTPLGFVCEPLVFGEVTNLWAYRPSTVGAPLLVFAGHTDVVPVGGQWRYPPFEPTRVAGNIYGRGAVDMKGSLAAMVCAIETTLASHQPVPALAMLLTSDEEGPAHDGTTRVCEVLRARGITPDYCVIGEPTSVARTGDMIKNGRRGSLSARVTIIGVQGHIAYPHLADNPIHRVAPALAQLAQTQWDQGNAYFPATTWQVSNIHGGTGAGNVIPGEVVIDCNFRFGTASTVDGLKNKFEQVLEQHQLRYEITWTVGAEPFLTPTGRLSSVLTQAIEQVCGITPELSTTGGTSDGRFLSKLCREVIECGPCNQTAHKVDEMIPEIELQQLQAIYQQVITRLT